MTITAIIIIISAFLLLFSTSSRSTPVVVVHDRVESGPFMALLLIGAGIWFFSTLDVTWDDLLPIPPEEAQGFPKEQVMEGDSVPVSYTHLTLPTNREV